MLYLSLIVSAVLLLVSHLIVRRSHRPGGLLALLCLASLVPLLVFCIAPAVTMQSVFLCAAASYWRRSGRAPGSFLPLSLAATTGAYVLAGFLVLGSEREFDRLRSLYPYVSIGDRLPLRPATSRPAQLPRSTTERLGRLEDGHDWGWFRSRQLRLLHEDALHLFINSPGFGVSRLGLPSAGGLALRDEPVPAQPGGLIHLEWAPGDRIFDRKDEIEPFGMLLEESIQEFVNSRAFGYVKDRRHVAGFVPHRFRRVPFARDRWAIRTLELVSLLLHESPLVYESPDLPRMDLVRVMPTRPLDRFERHGLEELRRGEDLLVSETRDGVRMLGAIRSVKQCQDCHGSDRGDLLGAFSYVLRREAHEPSP